MKESGKERFILTKAYEVAYALFRLAAQMQEADFAEQLRISGTALLSAAAKEDYAGADWAIRVMECLVKFGGDVGMIGTQNVDVLTREIYALDAAIAERKLSGKTDEVNVAEIFSKPEHKPATVGQTPVEPAVETPTEQPVQFHLEPEPEAAKESRNDSAIRQETILNRIRQSGNCRLKDIHDVLPDISERTIRYDLQTLLERGYIERIGNAGPSVFYRANVR